MLAKSVIVIVTLFGLAFAADIDIVDDNFEARIREADNTLVMFYAPWCGHCKRLKPEFAKAAEVLRGEDPAIALLQIDCDGEGKQTCRNHGVEGYPTLKTFKKHVKEPEAYSGPRDAHGIVKYMQSYSGPASKELTSLEALEKFLTAQETSIVGLFEKDSELKSVYLKYADKYRQKLRFGHSAAADALEKHGVSDGILLVRASQYNNVFEESVVKFEGSSLAELEAFVNKHFHGLVGHRERSNVADFKSPVVIAYYAIDYVKNAKGTNYWRNRILKAIKDYSGEFRFAISNKDDFMNELNEYGYDYAGDKPVVVARNAKEQKFVMKDEFSIDNLKKFIDDLENGLLEPYLKSEPVPSDNNGPVTVAVAKNFDDVVTNNGKDTLIEFYAPWCGHCKSLAPIYEELGEKLADEDVAIVKFDAASNDVPKGFEVRGYPTLFWLPRDSKAKPEPYNGERKLDNFVQFIAAHATDELKGFSRAGKPKKSEL